MNKIPRNTAVAARRRLKLTLAGLAAAAFCAPSMRAQTATAAYFDPNGASQSGAITGTWDASTTADWSTVPAGQTTPQLYTAGADAYFSATSGTISTATVAMGSAVNATGLYFINGATTITSGTFGITVGVDGVNVSNGASASVGNAPGAAGIITNVSQTWTNNNGSAAFIDGGGSIGGGTGLSGGLILANGSFQLGNTGQNNGIGGSASITVDTGATLTAGGATSALASHPVYLNGGTISSVVSKSVGGINAFLEANSSSSVSGATGTPMASLALDGNYTLTALAGSFTVISVINNGTAGTNLTIAGPSSGTTSGTVALNGTSTYTGTTTVGTLSVLSFGAGGAGGDINTGGGAGFTGGTVNDSGTVQFNHSMAYTFNGHITGAGGVTNVAGTNTLSDGTSDYTGVTTVSGGILAVPTLSNGGVASSIGASTSVAANLVLDPGGTLQYTGSGGSTNRLFTLYSSNTIGMTLDASGTGAINFTNTGSLPAQGGKAFTFTVTGSSTANNTLSPVITNYNGSNLTSLAKTGAGTWVLTNANLYSGATTVSAGTLLLNNTTGSGTGSGVVNVTGGTLGGSGFISSGANAINIGNGTTGGTITGGAIGSVGMLTFTTTNPSGVIFNGASSSLSTYSVDLSGMTSDNLKINGNLTLTGANDHITFTGTATAGSYDLINYTGVLSGTFTEQTNDLPAGYSLAYNSGEIDLVAAVPEPGTWMGGFLGLAVAGYTLHKRRRSSGA